MESQGYSGPMSVGKTLLEDGNAVFGLWRQYHCFQIQLLVTQNLMAKKKSLDKARCGGTPVFMKTEAVWATYTVSSKPTCVSKRKSKQGRKQTE